MKKIARSAAMVVFALVLTLGLCAVGQTDAQAAAKKKVKSVQITSPVKVKSGKTGKYTLYQVKGKKASKTIKAKIKVTGKASKKIYFKSSKKSVLKVGKTTGKMTTTGKKTGTATITAYAKGNSKVNAKIKVTVKNFKPKLTVKGFDNAIYKKGKTIKGSVSVKGAGVESVTYSSNNKKVVKVDKKGNLTGKAIGEAVISAKVKAKSGAAVTLKETVTVKDSKRVPKYAKYKFDFSAQIKTEMAQTALTPAAADVPFTITDEKGATGVMVVKAADANDSSYYMNGLAAGHKLIIAPKSGSSIKEVKSDRGTAVAADTDGSYSLTPAALTVGADGKVAGEVITVTAGDGTSYAVNTVSDCMPGISVTNAEKLDPANAGVYTFAVDKFLLRVNTKKEVVYYRNLLCTGELMAENVQRHETKDGVFYSYFVELRKEYRNANGGYSSGMYVVMDENYKDIEKVTMSPNSDKKHPHGEGYLDQHEFIVMGNRHYLTLSYTPLYVTNIPKDAGTKGSTTGYVWAGIFQEVKDGKVINEINTADYPLLYESAVEKLDYKNSTDKGVQVQMGQNMVLSLADGWQDYVHPNSLDYTLKSNGTVDKLLISMRDQCAVYQFDMSDGYIEWILGGKASTLSGFDKYTTTRKDEAGNSFKALTYGQHFARYTNRNEDGTISGNPEISVFDNQTGSAPFLSEPLAPDGYANKTRTFKAVINNQKKSAKVSDVIDGMSLNAQTGKYHNASHCGSVQYINKNSVVIGWGLHGAIDSGQLGGPLDKGYNGNLYQGCRPIVSEYDPVSGNITFELTAMRNPKVTSHEALFSYRTYKTAE